MPETMDMPATTTVKKRPNGAKVDYPKAAVMLASGCTTDHIAKTFGVTVESLRVGLSRKGISRALIEHTQLRDKRVEKVAENALQAASERFKAALAGELEKSASTLGRIPAKATLRNLKERGEVIEPLARTAKIVFEWGNQVEVGLIALGQVASMDPEESSPPVDVESEVVADNMSDLVK